MSGKTPTKDPQRNAAVRGLLQTAIAACAAACLVAPAIGEDAAFDVTYGVEYCQRETGGLKADMYVPKGEGPFPGVLVVHGGAWRMGTRAQLSGIAQMLARHGMTAAAISYRLAPQSQFPAQIEDCKAAVRWMRSEAAKWKIDPAHIGACGYSAGGQLVALLGTTDARDGLEGIADPENQPSTRLQAVAAGGAPCEFRTLPPELDFLSFWLGGSRGERPQQYVLASARAFVTSDDPPMFLFHGAEDDLVPVESPKAMRESLATAGVETELYVAPNCGHMAAAMDKTSLDKAIAFLELHLKPKDADKAAQP